MNWGFHCFHWWHYGKYTQNTNNLLVLCTRMYPTKYSYSWSEKIFVACLSPELSRSFVGFLQRPLGHSEESPLCFCCQLAHHGGGLAVFFHCYSRPYIFSISGMWAGKDGCVCVCLVMLLPLFCLRQANVLFFSTGDLLLVVWKCKSSLWTLQRYIYSNWVYSRISCKTKWSLELCVQTTQMHTHQ